MQPIKLYWSVRSKNAALGLRENSEAGERLRYQSIY